MKEALKTLLKAIFGLGIGLVFYLLYVHFISAISYPLGIVVVLFVSVILVGATINFLINMKDFVVSIFKDNKEVDEKGFKKF